MSDEEAAVLFISLFMAAIVYVIYQKLFVIRPLRKKLDRIVDAALERPAQQTLPSAPAPAELGELERIRSRLQVLERIAVEKEDTLSREIDELRAADR